MLYTHMNTHTQMASPQELFTLFLVGETFLFSLTYSAIAVEFLFHLPLGTYEDSLRFL